MPNGFLKITVKKQLRNLHPLVKSTYDHLFAKRASDYYDRVKPFEAYYAGVLVSKKQLKRATLLLDALFRELERQGFLISGYESQRVVFTKIQNETDSIYLRIEEEGKQTRVKSEEIWREYDYDYYTTGILRLKISHYESTYSCKTISDGKNQTLEESFEKILIQVIQAFKEAKSWRLEREEWHRKMLDHEEKRKQRELQEKEEQRKREQLEQASEAFTKSQYIYQFLEEIEKKKSGLQLTNEQENKFEEWMRWARKHAIRIDPIEKTISSIINLDNSNFYQL